MCDDIFNSLSGNKWIRDYPHTEDKTEDGKPYWVKCVGGSYTADCTVYTVAGLTKLQDNCLKILKVIAGIKDTKNVEELVNKEFNNKFGASLTVSKTGKIDIESPFETPIWPTTDWYNLKRTGDHKDTFYDYYCKWIDNVVDSLRSIKKNIEQVINEKSSDDKEEMLSRLSYLKVMYNVLTWTDTVCHDYPSTAYELNMETPVTDRDDVLATDSED